MLHLRKCIFHHILPPPPTASSIPPISSLHRLLSATSIPFTVEDYLVANCGLSPAQALKASKKLSHLKSPSKPDAVLHFLAGLGLSRSDFATVVSNDPRFLCADVEKTLAPRVVELTDLGLSPPDIARLVLIGGCHFHSSLRRNVDFWLQVFSSIDKLLAVVKVSNCLLSSDLEKVVKPNLAFLQGCGISVSKLPKAYMCRMVTTSTKHLQEALARVNEFGIERNSLMFTRALATFAIVKQATLDANVQLFEKLGWSRDDIAQGARRAPHILVMPEEKVRRNLAFLTGDVRLEIPYIAQKPALMAYSLERRLLPRHRLINFLKAKGLLNTEHSFFYIATLSNEKFLLRFVHRYEDSIPGLPAAFASSCAGNHLWEQL
ncbi:hypothetical protein EJB05_45619, partial [Eragrostis curvula]